MIHPQQLLADLQSLLPKLEQDILSYTQTRPELEAHLQAEYANAKEANRTAEHFVAWREAQITQAAAAWVLTCVFVRFLEDNGLLAMPMLSGPADSSGQGALQQAKDRTTVYFSEHPTHAERDYLLAVFAELETLPALGELLDRAHNPLWRLPLSADGAKASIDFFQRLDPETGAILHDFTDPEWDTRFLGDLYQDLSESVRKRYALLQTPEFVEDFILDCSLEPAKAAFGLPGLKLIDPTCGSGHFLLGAFQRLFAGWQRREPATNARALAQRARRHPRRRHQPLRGRHRPLSAADRGDQGSRWRTGWWNGRHQAQGRARLPFQPRRRRLAAARAAARMGGAGPPERPAR